MAARQILKHETPDSKNQYIRLKLVDLAIVQAHNTA